MFMFREGYVDYLVRDMSLSPNDVMQGIGAGLAQMQRDLIFDGAVLFVLSVNEEVVELVEDAARRAGVPLERAEYEEEE